MRLRIVSFIAVFALASCRNADCTTRCQGEAAQPASCLVDGVTRRSYLPAQSCSNGCVIDEVDTVCPERCLDGACVEALDAGPRDAGAGDCANMTCTTAPSSMCSDAQHLRVFEPRGVCSAGECLYSAREELCVGGCASGACVNNPCQGVTCNQPPANSCVDATTLRTFSSGGTCSGGACSYTSTTSTCAFGCASGACVNNPCQGVTCNQPPANSCVDATDRKSVV